MNLTDLTLILTPILSMIIFFSWIAVLVAMIRHRDLLGGVLSAFPVLAFIVGWVDVRRYQLLTPMVAWTGSLVVGIVLLLIS